MKKNLRRNVNQHLINKQKLYYCEVIFRSIINLEDTCQGELQAPECIDKHTHTHTHIHTHTYISLSLSLIYIYIYIYIQSNLPQRPLLLNDHLP